MDSIWIDHHGLHRVRIGPGNFVHGSDWMRVFVAMTNSTGRMKHRNGVSLDRHTLLMRSCGAACINRLERPPQSAFNQAST